VNTTKTAIVVAGVAAFALSTPAFAQKTTPEYASGAARPKSVALLPVNATVTRARVVEAESLVDDGVQFGAQFDARMASLMAAKGYEVSVVGVDRLDADPKLQEYVVEATREFDDATSKCKPRNVPKHLCKVGDAARVLAAYLHVDALVFSALNLTITPAGRAIVTALFGGTAASASSSLDIVDGRSGELEALFFAGAVVLPGDKTDDEMREYVATLAERTANRMPSSDPSARIEAKDGDERAVEDAELLLTK
jgi:hypothetical protein